MPNDHKPKSWLLAEGIVKFGNYYHKLMILLIFFFWYNQEV